MINYTTQEHEVNGVFQVKMSVKALAEFLYQHGDLTSSFLSAERANIGSRIHRMLQKRGGEAYQSEVFLKETTRLNEIDFIIDGRADGVIKTDQGIVIDEIKTVTCDYEDISEDMNITHWAQAYGYAYIYAKQHACSDIIVQLTYYQIDIDEIKQFQQRKTFDECKEFYMGMLQAYYDWAMRIHTFHERRDASLKALSFPFPHYRAGQRELAIAVYKTILDEDVMFAQAPTGIGKTISALFPACKALGEGKIERIFYLCAKNVTAKVAKDSIKQMLADGLRIKCVAITAKEKMCLMEEQNCDPEVCPFAKGYYDKLRPALVHLMDHADFMDRDLFREYGRNYQICPFEFSLDACMTADIIICDYNYVFDPRVYLKRFFSEPGDYLFLIDEAHNMVDRARSMYSAQLSLSMFREMRNYMDKDAKKCRKLLRAVMKEMEQQGELCKENGCYAYREPKESFFSLLGKLQKEVDLYLQKEHEHNEDIKTMYFEVLAFARIADYYDDHFITWVKKEGKEITVKQYCMNPNRAITRMLHMGKAAVFFSATLTPIRYFTDLLLDQECTKKIALPSPFDQKRAKLLIHCGINTRYRMREASIDPICSAIEAAITEKKGNYIVFFPSYAYLKQVADRFTSAYPDIHLEVQESNMKEEERQHFLALFEEQDDTMVCFCVLGGMFAEGIDFKGDRLIGVIVVGVGLPQINYETDLLRDYFDTVYGKGYAYAYVYPGMNKVLQAAGRLIRDAADCGVILFLDERYDSAQYRMLFPLHMRHYEIIQDTQGLHQHLSAFWQKMDADAKTNEH